MRPAGLLQPVHGLSRWCSRHHGLSLRYGSPTQERVLRRETKEYERMVSRLIASNKSHPAFVLVVNELDDMLATADQAHHRHAFHHTRP